MSRKNINLSQEEDFNQWNKIKLQEINRRSNPNLKDTELLRYLMDNYEADDQKTKVVESEA